jgi:outer membrane protein OmpA-like peptidoglycan-associated protein
LETARAAQEGLAMSKICAKSFTAKSFTAKSFTAMSFTAILSIVTIGAALSVGFVGKATAGDANVTEDQIVRALAPPKQPLTRGLSIGPQTSVDPAVTASETKFVSTIRGRTTRSLSNTEREEIATMAKDKPNIDLEITFDYNSADISAKSLPSVQALGRALTSAELKGSTFIVAGHTDAAGGEAYNQDLSERRADSIKHYLMDKFSIAASDLVTVGYGKSKLKDPNQPMAEMNRRVQVVNMENKTTASK